MSKIERFEDIVAWQKARELTEQIYNQADEVWRLLSGFMAYLRQSELRGRKFK